MVRTTTGLWGVVILGALLQGGLCDGSPQKKFALIVDAGSSGNRLRIYELHEKNGLNEVKPKEEDEDHLECEPGVSSYQDNVEKASPPLKKMFEAAAKYIPSDQRRSTPIWIKATAGMRLVPADKLEKLWDAVDAFFKEPENCPFKYMGSEVLGGEEEAVFAWIGMNYIQNVLFKGEKFTRGVLDMGGASMQVAFHPKGDIMGNEFSFYLKEYRKSIYAKSFIQFGVDTAITRAKAAAVQNTKGCSAAGRGCLSTKCCQDAALKCYKKNDKWADCKATCKVGAVDPNSPKEDQSPWSCEVQKKAQDGGTTQTVDFPCFHSGYDEQEGNINFRGTGDADACAKLVEGLLHEDYECLLEPCALMGVHMSPVQTYKKFWGLANYFYIANGLGLIGWNEHKVITPGAILKATEKFCAMPMDAAKNFSSSSWKYQKKRCFGGLYVHRVLRAYGIPDDDERIEFARKVDGKSADWTLGATLYETQFMPFELSSRVDGCTSKEAESAVHDPQQEWSAVDAPPVQATSSGVPAWFPSGLAMMGLLSVAVAWLVAQRRRRGPMQPQSGLLTDVKAPE